MTHLEDAATEQTVSTSVQGGRFPKVLLWVRSIGGRSYFDSIFFAGLSGVASVTVTFLTARLLGAGQYGWIVLGLSIGNLLVPIVNLGSERVLVRDLIPLSTAADRMRLLSDNVGVRLLVSVPLMILLVAGAFVYAGFSNRSLTVASIAIWAMLQGLYPYSLFDYLRRTALHNALAAVERIIALGLVLLLFVAPTSVRQASVLSVMLMVTRITSVVWQYKFWGRVARKLGLSIKLRLVGLRSRGTSVLITAVQLSSACVVYVNQIFLGASRHRGDLAAYGLVFQIATFVLVLQSQILRLFLNDIASACHERAFIVRRLFKHVTIITAVSTAFAMLSWAISYVLSLYLAGDGFRKMPVLATPLAVWTVVAGVGLVVTQYLINLKRETSYFVINFSGGLTMLVLGYLLVPRYGAYAAALLVLLVHGAMITAQSVAVGVELRDHFGSETR